MNNIIADIRKEYRLHTLDEKDVAADAIEQFTKWWKDALASEILEVNALTLATAAKTGKPSARTVLLKGFDENGFVFFTNYESHKGKEINENACVALVFFWKEIERQIRIEGTCKKTPDEENDTYFFSRPEGSRIGAWASPQSEIIKNRNIIEENADKFLNQFKSNIPRPPHWGGYRVMPQLIEFWQGRSNRLHDRIQYTKTDSGSWKIDRLAP